jgi:hypothetical protein
MPLIALVRLRGDTRQAEDFAIYLRGARAYSPGALRAARDFAVELEPRFHFMRAAGVIGRVIDHASDPPRPQLAG